jgi:hypothetical protein
LSTHGVEGCLRLCSMKEMGCKNVCVREAKYSDGAAQSPHMQQCIMAMLQRLSHYWDASMRSGRLRLRRRAAHSFGNVSETRWIRNRLITADGGEQAVRVESCVLQCVCTPVWPFEDYRLPVITAHYWYTYQRDSPGHGEPPRALTHTVTVSPRLDTDFQCTHIQPIPSQCTKTERV